MSGNWMTVSVLLDGKRKQIRVKVKNGQRYAFRKGKFVATGNIAAISGPPSQRQRGSHNKIVPTA